MNPNRTMTRLKSNAINIDLQLNLLNTWTKFKVADYYQQIFLAHADELTHVQAEDKIKKEIKMAIEKRSPYFQFEKINQERKNVLTVFKDKLQQTKQIKNMQTLSTMCTFLKQVRQVNLKTAQYIIKMYHMYHCKNIQAADTQMEYYDILLENLDRDLLFLKKSQLTRYLVFDQGYDPFMMSPYQQIHRNQMNNLSQPIKELYTLSISYAYKLMKTKNVILELRSLLKPSFNQERNKKLPYTENLKERIPDFSHLKRSSGFDRNMDTDRQTLKDQPVRLKPIQIFPSAEVKSRYSNYSEKQPKSFYNPNAAASRPGKLNIYKVDKGNQSHSSSFRFEPLAHRIEDPMRVQKYDDFESPKRYGQLKKSSKRSNSYHDKTIKDKKSSEPKRSQSIRLESEPSQKYKIGIGEIYRRRLTPIKRHITQGNILDSSNENSQRGEIIPSGQTHGIKKQSKNNQQRQKLPQLGKSQISQKRSIRQKPQFNKRQDDEDLQQRNSERSFEIDPEVKIINHYNPVTGQEFQLRKQKSSDKKYVFDPHFKKGKSKGMFKPKLDDQQSDNSDDRDLGLTFEPPCSKYNIRPRRKYKKMSLNPSQQHKNVQNQRRVDSKKNIVSRMTEESKRPQRGVNQDTQTEINQRQNDSKVRKSGPSQMQQNPPQYSSKNRQSDSRPVANQVQGIKEQPKTNSNYPQTQNYNNQQPKVQPYSSQPQNNSFHQPQPSEQIYSSEPQHQSYNSSHSHPIQSSPQKRSSQPQYQNYKSSTQPHQNSQPQQFRTTSEQPRQQPQPYNSYPQPQKQQQPSPSQQSQPILSPQQSYTPHPQQQSYTQHPQQQSSRQPQQQSYTSYPQQQPSRQPEQQLSRQPQQQSSRQPEQQLSRQPQQQLSRQPEQQLSRQPHPQQQSSRQPQQSYTPYPQQRLSRQPQQQLSRQPQQQSSRQPHPQEQLPRQPQQQLSRQPQPQQQYINSQPQKQLSNESDSSSSSTHSHHQTNFHQPALANSSPRSQVSQPSKSQQPLRKGPISTLPPQKNPITQHQQKEQESSSEQEQSSQNIMPQRQQQSPPQQQPKNPSPYKEQSVAKSQMVQNRVNQQPQTKPVSSIPFNKDLKSDKEGKDVKNNQQDPNKSVMSNEPKSSRLNASSLRQSSTGKKQIRMRVGKSNVQDIVALIEKIKIDKNYEPFFDKNKIILWVKTNQCYLLYFYMGNQLAILSLCSPIPSIGIFIKLWAPVEGVLQQSKVILTLFKKYVEYIQKSSTCDRILYSGRPFPGIQESQFKMKKQNVYQRQRKLPKTKSPSEFLPFVYIQCSNVRFQNKGDTVMLYSNQIQEFTENNSFAADFMGSVQSKVVPQKLQHLIKYTSQIQNFIKVNEILTDQDFDNYEANQLYVQGIQLIRMFFNSPIKTTFAANQDYLKFWGLLLFQQGDKYLCSAPVLKNNGNIYFGKNLSLPSMLQYSKRKPTAKVPFSVMMFNKKLYGRLPQYPLGCYGCWQINLIWQDELPGKVIHSKQKYVFGSDQFSVMIELQGKMLFGFTVTSQDSI